MTAFVSHLSYDFRTGLRDRSLMLMNYLFPLFFFVMMATRPRGATLSANERPAMPLPRTR